MEKFPGTELPVTVLPPHSRICDLQYYQGPLVSEFQDERKEKYLYYWCDTDEVVNRWLVIPIRGRELIQLKWQMMSAHELLIVQKSETILYVLDIDQNFSRQRLSLCRVQDLPESYIPDSESFFDVNLMPVQDSKVFPILIDGGRWEVEEFYQFPLKFSDAYVLQYYYENKGEIQFKERPFKGGYSTVNFYAELRALVGRGNLPSVRAMSYASPGFIEFNADLEVATKVGRSVLRMRENGAEAAKLYREIEKYIRDRGTNQEPGSANLDIYAEQFLASRASHLLDLLLAPPWQWLSSLSRSVFESTKEAMAHYRRLGELVKLVKEGKISFEHLGRTGREAV